MLARLLVDLYFAFGASFVAAQTKLDTLTQVTQLLVFSNASFQGQKGSLSFGGPGQGPNTTITIFDSPQSISFSPDNSWAIIISASGPQVFWDPVPDVSQLPPEASNLTALLNVQSASCSPQCASYSICSTSGTCLCPPGFTGTSCESCSPGFFGQECLPCPSGCATCDQGSGICIGPITSSNSSETCSCGNGQCLSNGQCLCNTGWTSSPDGTACSQCEEGYYQTSTGDCKICQLGCNQCAETFCISCQNGLTQNQNENENTQCVPETNNNICPPQGSYYNGSQCLPCYTSCSACTGPSMSECFGCVKGLYMFNGSCVPANSVGVCDGTNGGLIADNDKGECDTCGGNCTSCEIPNFGPYSIVDLAVCTGCLPGTFLSSNGTCIESCPSGTFVSPKDNLTCIDCEGSCATCSGSPSHCLTCSTSTQFVSSGQCVSSCPPGTISSSGTCIPCHPDCATCTGPAFDQCSTCSQFRPVFQSGRCLLTCNKNQYFDQSTSSCQDCDPSCGSCAGPKFTHCLSCPEGTSNIVAGTCPPYSQQGN